MDYSPHFFSKYHTRCPDCGQRILDSVLDISLKNDEYCDTCLYHYNEFKRFWSLFASSSDDITMLARSDNARELLNRVFLAFSYKGIHKPLVLPSSMKIEITRRCNLSCKHCLANSTPEKYTELSTSEIVDLMAQAKELGVRSFGFVGGEPFLREDLHLIVEAANKMGVSYSVSSNGMLITKESIKSIIGKHLSKVSISLDGDREYHNNLRRNKNAYDYALRGVRILKSESIPVAVAMMINRENKHLIQAVIEDAISVGADYFMINDLIPTGRGLEIKENCLSYSEYLEVTEEMQNIRKQYGSKIKILWKGMNPGGKSDDDLGNIFTSKCGAALTELTVNNEGFVLPCPFLPATTENIKRKKLKEIWYNSSELSEYQRRDNLTGGCGTCHKQYSCSGCRARALAHTGSINGPDIRCPLCQ